MVRNKNKKAAKAPITGRVAKSPSSLDNAAGNMQDQESSTRAASGFSKHDEKKPVPPTPSPRLMTRYKGPWLEITAEVLESIAHINYNTPRPRPVDPAVMFNLAKILKSVGEASDLATRAASDMASSTLASVGGGGLGTLSSHSVSRRAPAAKGVKLTPERKFRMRELAVRKLAQAYRVDEMAASLAVMRGPSALDDLGALVLDRSPRDADANLVHFFHEKVAADRVHTDPSGLRLLAAVRTVEPGHPEVLRTMATAKYHKGDFEGAIQDIKDAMYCSGQHKGAHQSNSSTSQQAPHDKGDGRRPLDVILPEGEQPSGLQSRLMFLRGNTYLCMAIRSIPDSIHVPAAPTAHDSVPEASSAADDQRVQGDSAEQVPAKEQEYTRGQAESQRNVRAMAKRALRDLMAFVGDVDYSPNLPIRFCREFLDRVYSSSLGNAQAVCEWVTFHPLLADALHSILLCHCLAQTPAAELRRLAYSVARIVSLLDGYPAFHTVQPATRSDWTDVLAGTGNWLKLCASWEALCFPMPLPNYGPSKSPALALVNGGSAKGRPGQGAGPPKYGPERPPAPLHGERHAQGSTAHHQHHHHHHYPGRLPHHAGQHDKDKGTQSGKAGSSTCARCQDALDKAPPSGDDGQRRTPVPYRVECIIRWILHAPPVPAAAKRKTRGRKRASLPGDGAAEGVAKLGLEDAQGVHVE
ncbi:hypothetical protein HIM_02390 [Hirsutella minnesotensis 3608]|nr:hypothetical protein HIM_02390 [Hirsutella minnesotensis 3608]